MSKRELRSGGSTSAQSLDASKVYKLNSAGTLVEATSVAGTDIVFTGSKSALRRINDLERNVSILAARTQTEDGSGDGTGSGTVEKANKLATSRTISLTGDVTGSASFDGSANASITATIAANSVALGTDTTGNYVASLVAGTGITLTNNTGESATPTVAVDTSTIATQSWVTTQIATKDNTDEITEGATNLYFTNARARGAVSFTAGSGAYNSSTGVFTIPTNTNQLTNGASFITLSSLSAGTGITYNSSTGAITNSDLGSSQNIFKNFTDGTTTAAADSNNDTFKFRGSAGVTVAVASDDATHGDSLLVSLSAVPNSSLANSSITINGTAVSLGGTRTLSTTDIGEGTNLYYTDARARAAHSFTAGSGGYNSTTGVITIPTNTNQLTNGAGFITGYTETDTLATVTGRGATTATAVSFTNATASTSSITGAVVVTGGVGIGGKLNVGGAAAVTGALTATGEITAYFSDKRLKENIKPIENALAKTLQLHGVTYNANDVAASFGYTSKAAQVGLLAQDVKAVLPEVIAPAPFDVKVVDGKEVSKSGEDYITVKYEKIVALLVEAIKELNDKVESLEAQLGGSKSL